MPQNVGFFRSRSSAWAIPGQFLVRVTALATALATSLAIVNPVATAGEPAAESVQSLVQKLGHESSLTRRHAAQDLLALAAQTDAQDREQIVQAMLREALTAEFEAQLAINRLWDEILTLNHRQHVDTILANVGIAIDIQSVGAGPVGTGPETAAFVNPEFDDSPLAQQWRIFAFRAGDDAEARELFRTIAWAAGPSLSWPQFGNRRDRDFHSSGMGITLISQLGCVAPDTPRLLTGQAKQVLWQIRQASLATQTVTRSDPSGRVMDRLIDRTLLENPYGWTVPERLHLSLLYRRDRVTAAICRDVLRAAEPLAGDLAAAILAHQQLLTHRAVENVATSEKRLQHVLAAAAHDRRIVTVSPEQLVGGIAVQTVPASTTPAIVRTRVQDVALWATLQDPRWDLRQHGMRGLQADPVWGTRLPSIGFTSDHERAAFLTWAATAQAIPTTADGLTPNPR